MEKLIIKFDFCATRAYYSVMIKNESIHFRINKEELDRIKKLSIKDGRRVASMLSSWVSMCLCLEEDSTIAKLEKLAEARGTSVEGFITSLIRSL